MDQLTLKKHPEYDVLVSTCGRVFHMSGTEKKLTQRPDGYMVTSVAGRGTTAKRVHHLVLETHVGPKPSRGEVRHLDGNPRNNNVSNLCWGNRYDQIQDQKRHGTFKAPPRLIGPMNHHYRGVMDSEAMRTAIDRVVLGGGSLRSISVDCGVSRTHLSRQIKKLGVQKGGTGS